MKIKASSPDREHLPAKPETYKVKGERLIKEV
jgi:hypothetical protein